MKILKFSLAIGLFALYIACGSSGEKVRHALIETEMGNMKLELYNSTPGHRDNFIKLVNDGFYDDLLFHRVINGFMVQGGDPNSKGADSNTNLGSGGPGYQIPAEIGAPHFKGTLAAARTGAGNPEKKSSGSQFYLVQGRPQNAQSLQAIAKSKGFQYNEAQIKKYTELGGTPNLDMDYTVYGEVIEGIEVIDKIATVQTNPSNRPLSDVKMKIRMLD